MTARSTHNRKRKNYTHTGRRKPPTNAAYEFLASWDEPATKAVLEKNGLDIRISVYHYADRQFERLSNATRNPNELLQGIRWLLDPIPAGEGILTLLPGNGDLSAPSGSSAWLWESIVASLNDATAASPVSARRVLIVFSEGYSGTSGSGTRQNVADRAVALGVPIYPVILDRNKYVEHPIVLLHTYTPGPYDTEVQPRSPDAAPLRYAPASPASPLGDMTDGSVYFPSSLDRKTMNGILEGVRDAELAKYVVGFVPEPSQAPRKRTLEVVLRSKSIGKVVGGRRDASY